jgi:ABC-2 type transport system permease protein
VLRYGSGAEALAWGMMFVIFPLSGVFYPVDVLPTIVQPIAYALPTTHAFAALRELVDGGGIAWGQLGLAAIGTVVLIALAGWYLVAMLRRFRRRGYVTRYT